VFVQTKYIQNIKPTGHCYVCRIYLGALCMPRHDKYIINVMTKVLDQ